MSADLLRCPCGKIIGCLYEWGLEIDYKKRRIRVRMGEVEIRCDYCQRISNFCLDKQRDLVLA